MRRRRHWLWLGLLLGFSASPTLGQENAPAVQLWQEGQAAMRSGKPDEAIRFYQQSLTTDPGLVQNHLSLAVAYLRNKQSTKACGHLAVYVKVHPEQHLIRSRYAELLARLGRFDSARQVYEYTIADAQELGGPPAEQIPHYHSRIVQIAEVAEDPYHEHLHRGIGLYLLGCKRCAIGDPEGEFPAEGLFCKAVAELTQAQIDRPEEARPSWYLHCVWSKLGRRPPALQQLLRAAEAAPFSYLTATEQRDLQFADRACRMERNARR